jgi:uncharacterized membrane protein YGL010W
VAYAWAWAAGGFVLGWYAQIHPGHMMLEGRRPALLDSFFQARSTPCSTFPLYQAALVW